MSPLVDERLRASPRIVKIPLIVDIPVQFFQSVIAIDLAVAGALLWQIRTASAGKDAATKERDSDYTLTLLGLVLYVAVVAGFLVLLEID